MTERVRAATRRGIRRQAEPAAAPNRAALHEAALAYLGRTAATADSVAKALGRHIANWARRALRAGRDAEDVEREAGAARELVPAIVARLIEVGLVNDAAFAETRARRMASAGRSRRAIKAHLAQKGVAESLVRESVRDDARTELVAAVAFARRRRIGPFAREEDAERTRDEQRASDRKALAAMARAGFDFGVCERVLRMSAEDAQQQLHERDEL